MTDRLRRVTITAFNRTKYIFREYCKKILYNKERYYCYCTSNRTLL
jgi:hypothetical protein